MDHDEFSSKVRVLRGGIDAKLRRPSTAGSEPNQAEAIEDLRGSLEELTVAEEELRQQYEQLALARQRYQELFDLAPDAYLATDSSGNIQEANRAAAKLFQIPMQFIVGKPLLQFVASEEHQGFMKQLHQLRTGVMESVESWEVTIQPRMGGPPLHAAMTVGAARDRFSRLVGLRWLIRVITPSTARRSR
jgi:PAS domain S-box-containing protein